MPVGIMADSHGRPETLSAALRLFAAHGCATVYHLGDICDSLKPDTVGECIRIVSQNSVRAVKGNNEHALVVNHAMNGELPVPPQVIDYLKQLEPVILDHYAVFAHSLPFYRELGVSCMIRGMTEEAASRFMDMFPDNVLFRGHSHVPEIIWRNSDSIMSRRIEAGEEVYFGDRVPCVITCGALTRGMCMQWEPGRMAVKSLSFSKGE